MVDHFYHSCDSISQIIFYLFQKWIDNYKASKKERMKSTIKQRPTRLLDVFRSQYLSEKFKTGKENELYQFSIHFGLITWGILANTLEL